ncbi:unnamed protein product [Phaedon cochleariae]|uniref:Uncharacterized protein n=1 Tax=Phaedon cochleariae TaxID=80249 RepID=A0A9N9X1H9_PHACE|nr:unnamed protein product [Phaedon cochleariae]
MIHNSLLKRLNINYIFYSHIAARTVRKSLKPEFLKSAMLREQSVIKIYSYKNGKKSHEVHPLTVKESEDNIIIEEKQKIRRAN